MNKWNNKFRCQVASCWLFILSYTTMHGSMNIKSFLNLGARWGGWSKPRPGRSLPPGKTRYPLYRRLGGPQGRSGQVWKISHPLVFDPRTIQLVASRYAYWAITAPTLFKVKLQCTLQTGLKYISQSILTHCGRGHLNCLNARSRGF